MKAALAPTVALALAASATPGAAPPAAAASATTLRVATLAQDESPWLRVLRAWNLTARKETDETLELDFQVRAGRTDERDLVRALRAGQVDGATLTVAGLAQVVQQSTVLSLPGVVDGYDAFDRVQEALRERFEGMFEQQGFKLLGWGHAGQRWLFSIGRIERPSDLKARRAWVSPGDRAFAELLKIVGARAVRLAPGQVSSALSRRRVDTLQTSAVSAVSWQWDLRLPYVARPSPGIVVGATIIRRDRFEALTSDQRKVLLQTGARAHVALDKMIRRDDAWSYQTMLDAGTTEVDTSEHREAWNEVYRLVRERLAGRVYPKSLLDSVIAAAGNRG